MTKIIKRHLVKLWHGICTIQIEHHGAAGLNNNPCHQRDSGQRLTIGRAQRTGPGKGIKPKWRAQRSLPLGPANET